MKGPLFQHPTIVLELLQCITPLDYMMLRRATPIFIRSPKVYPSVEDMGFKDFPLTHCTGLHVLGILCDEHIDSNVDEMIDVSGVSYENFARKTLRIRNLDAVRLRTFAVDILSYAKAHFAIFKYPIYGTVNDMFDRLQEYRKHGFNIVLKYTGRGDNAFYEEVGWRIIAKWNNEGSI